MDDALPAAAAEMPMEPPPPPPPPPAPPLRHRLAPYLLGAVSISVFLTSFVVGYLAMAPQNELVMTDQPYTPRLHIKKVTLVRGGFVVVRTAQRALQVVAQTDYLPADTYLDIPADSSEPFAVKPASGDTVFAEIYEDTDGNRQLSFADRKAKDRFGKAISQPLKLHGEIGL